MLSKENLNQKIYLVNLYGELIVASLQDFMMNKIAVEYGVLVINESNVIYILFRHNLKYLTMIDKEGFFNFIPQIYKLSGIYFPKEKLHLLTAKEWKRILSQKMIVYMAMRNLSGPVLSLQWIELSIKKKKIIILNGMLLASIDDIMSTI